MVWFYMAIVVCLGTILWPVGRWVMQKDGQSEVLGFWISIAAAFSAGIMLLVMRKPFFVPGIWVAGLWMGVAYSIGFCVLIMGSLKVGPTSLTTVLNNMAMVIPGSAFSGMSFITQTHVGMFYP